MKKVFQKDIRFDKIGTFLLVAMICIMSVFGSSVYAVTDTDVLNFSYNGNDYSLDISKNERIKHFIDDGYSNIVLFYYYVGGEYYLRAVFHNCDIVNEYISSYSFVFSTSVSYERTFELFVDRFNSNGLSLVSYTLSSEDIIYKVSSSNDYSGSILYSSTDILDSDGSVYYKENGQRGTGDNGSSTGGDIGGGNGDNDSDGEDNTDSGDSDIGIIDSIKNIAKNIIEIPIKIAETIADIFIPDTEKIKGYFEEVKQAYISKFSLSLDLSSMFSNGEQSSDFYITYKNRQYKILDISIFYTYYNNFRPFVRAFFAVLVFIYNYKKYQEFVGGGAE